jgi:hypothetical protein
MKYKMRKGNVKMIKVYQIQLTDAEIAAVNNGETSDRIQAYFDRSWPMSSFKAENFQYYAHVANVDTNDMEEAFAAMNLWEGATVEKLGPCSSMSVGDILEVDGKLFRCATFGFDAI